MISDPRSVRDEIHQTRPFHSLAEETVVALMRTSSIVRRACGKMVESFGISLAQYNVLRILRGAGEDGLPTLGVRDRLVEEAPGITRLIDKLEKAKLVRRDRTGSDRRTVRVHITSAGTALLGRMEHLVPRFEERITVGLPDERDQQTLLDLLSRIRAGND